MPKRSKWTDPEYLVPDAVALQLGRLVAAWAFVELQLEWAIWSLAKVDARRGRLFTSRLDVRPKTEIIDGLLADYEVDENRREHWKLAKPLLVTLARDRNDYTHAWWSMAPPDIAIVMSTRRGNPTVGVYGTKWIKVDDLDQAISEVEKLSYHLTAFATPQLLEPDELLPSSYTPRRRPRRRSSPDHDEPTTPRRPPRSSRA